MKSSTTSDFWRLYRSLRPEVRQQARKAYRLWRENPGHPSLRFERKGDYGSVRINRDHRALGRKHAGTRYWFWAGSHDEYERLINPLNRASGCCGTGRTGSDPARWWSASF